MNSWLGQLILESKHMEHGAEHDLRDLSKAARTNTMHYTLENGYRPERQVPLQRPEWIDVEEDGSLQVRCTGLNSRLPAGHFLELDYTQRRDCIPLPQDLERITAMVTESGLVRKAVEAISCMPVLPMLVPTPPLFLLLNAVPLDADPANTPRLPPFVSSGSLILRYLMVKLLLQGNQDLSQERRLDAENVYDRARERINQSVNEYTFPDWLIRQGRLFYGQFGRAEILQAQDDEERECLADLAKVLASSTIATIRNLEHYILSVLDKEIDADAVPPKDLMCESQAVRFEDVPAGFQQRCEKELNSDLTVFLPLRLRFLPHFYGTPQFPIPDQLEISSGSIPDYPISIQALKYIMAHIYIAKDFEDKEAAKLQPRRNLQTP
jgi:hypothetical protein